MASGYVVRKGQYLDSVFLMQVASRLMQQPGVEQAAALIGTENNKRLLAEIGLAQPEIDQAGPNDLIVGLIGEPSQIRAILDGLDGWLARPKPRAGATPMHSLEDAVKSRPGGNLAVISVPGQYAAAEARKALAQNLNVFLFSSNVSLDDEIALKRRARAMGLIVMGPDCGTALIGGVGLGFANAVRTGPIGAAAAMGTGLQEFTSQVHRRGLGISHAIGLGGRDLSDAVGGMAAFSALDALEADPATKVIALLSKPAGPSTLPRLVERLRRMRKPVVGCFLGTRALPADSEPGLALVRTIDEAVDIAIAMAEGEGTPLHEAETAAWDHRMDRDLRAMLPEQRYARGVFAGGTFCYQAQQILRDAGVRVFSNAPLEGTFDLAELRRGRGHSLIDMGAEEFTHSRPHPMIDASLRRERIQMEAEDPSVAVLLLDFVLGYNASPDPVGDLHDTIAQAQATVRKRGGTLPVIASICGTEEDPQGLGAQTAALQDAGVVVLPTAAKAARLCRDLVVRIGLRA